jgi:hypothetical protein
MQRRSSVIVCLLLVVAYFFCRFPELIALPSFFPAVAPLEKFYEARTLFFQNGHLNPQLATTVISSANSIFVYPPGILLLSYVLPTVRATFSCLFWLQLFVPLLVYGLFRKIMPTPWAAGIALLSIRFCTNSNWWGPDWLITPFMLFAFFLLWRCIDASDDPHEIDLVGLGLLTGLIAIFKHNIGLFFAVACGTALLFRSLSHAKNSQTVAGRRLVYLLLAGFWGFGGYFASRVIYFDEVIYYLFPYFAFWGIVSFWFARHKEIGLDVKGYLRQAGIFTLSIFLIAGSVFVWIASVVGYHRYWYSLFEMGFDGLKAFDLGIKGTLQLYVPWLSAEPNFGVAALVRGSTYLLLFLVPPAANTLLVYRCAKILEGRDLTFPWQKKCLAVASFSIVAIFTLFPLEGYQILAPKLIFYVLAAAIVEAYDTKNRSMWNQARPAVLVLLFLMVIDAVAKPLKIYHLVTTRGSAELQRAVGMPLDKGLANEMDKALEVIHRSVGRSPYYLIDPSMSLVIFKNIIPNEYPQYYLDIREHFLDRPTTAQVISEFPQFTYLLVNQDSYKTYLVHPLPDKLMNQIYEVVKQNYTPVDHYEAWTSGPDSNKVLPSFLVMKKI